MSSTEIPTDRTRSVSIVVAANLVVSLVTAGILVLYQVPLFKADQKLKALDSDIREIEKSISIQKNNLDLLGSNLEAAVGAMKLVENLSPRSSIKLHKVSNGTDFFEIIWVIENNGDYTFEEQQSPELIFSQRPLSGDQQSTSDPTLKVLYRSSPMGMVAPNGLQYHTAKIFRPPGVSTIYWRIKIEVVASPRLLRIARKLLPDSFASDIEEASRQFRLFYGEISAGK